MFQKQSNIFGNIYDWAKSNPLHLAAGLGASSGIGGLYGALTEDDMLRGALRGGLKGLTIPIGAELGGIGGIHLAGSVLDRPNNYLVGAPSGLLLGGLGANELVDYLLPKQGSMNSSLEKQAVSPGEFMVGLGSLPPLSLPSASLLIRLRRAL